MELKHAPGALAPPQVAVRLGLAALVLAAGLKVAWVCDDAYISFRSIDNLLQGHGLVWNPGERVQAFTHPLWLGLLALGAALTGELYWTAMGLGLACTAAAAFVLAGLGRAPGRWPVVLVLAASKGVAEFASSGLENSLSMLLVAAAAALALRQRWRGLGLVLGLFPVCRPDLGLVALPLVVGLLRRGEGRALALAALPLSLWTAFSLFYYGALVPNTALAKLGHGALGPALLQGLHYLWATVRWDPLAALVIVVGLVGCLRAEGPVRELGLGGLLYLGFSVASGGDFMAVRFHVVVVVIGVLGLLQGRGGPAQGPVLWAALALLAAVGNPRGPWRTGPGFHEPAWDDAGIADERGWYYAHLGVWPRLQSRRGAPEPGRGGEAAVVVGEAVGLDGYMGGPALHLVDVYGLCDPLLSRLPSSELRGRPGHWRRELPTGYRRTLETGENTLEDEELRAFWDDLHAATRGPLLAPGRAAAVWRVATTLRLSGPGAGSGQGGG